MQTTVLIISPEFLKKNTLIEENVDNSILEYNIKTAQDRYVLPILGSQLYKKIINDISGNTLSGDYLTLVDEYLIPCLTQFALYESAPNINYSFSNKGIVQKNDETINSVDLETTIYLRDNIKEMAYFYQKRIIDYVAVYSNLFPELLTVENDDIAPAKQKSLCGMYFPKRRTKYKCF